ncbi:cytochrome P450 3A8-like [Branchiostoma floridae]|uniref:Cytochrome P450 3A8-like n=1 Tax=Branchiostoma floridae TaxID=7739 RepID=A0A9J7MJJ9_BRAFL|nr:cytochrome P450 3A8-like [Branchiostoma floridae]
MELDFLPIPLTWVLLAALSVLFYLYCMRPMNMLKKMGIPHPKPLPVIGNMHQTMKTGVWNPDAQVERINKFGAVYGSYMGRTVYITISDPEMLREVFVKQFHKFTNRAPDGQSLNIKPSCRMMTQLVDEDWKNVRSTLSPAFSGGKLKHMSEAMNTCADVLLKNLGKFAEKGESFDSKDLTSGFTTDVIARTAFGLEVDSQGNPEDPFVVYTRKPFAVAFRNPLFWLFFLFPKIMKPILEFFEYSFLDKDVSSFFYNVVDQVMGMRQTEDKAHRHVDFMQLMMNAHKEDDDDDNKEEGTQVQGTKQPLTRDDIVANGFLFFIAGYETTATTMGFLLYNLALHQEAQDKAREEINQVMEGRELVDYEAVNKMSYLEMCIHETLRMYSPASGVVRVVGDEVKMKWLTLKKGMNVMIPILGIHNDPKRWPEPKKFIPERFTKEEREKRDQYDWLPFGAGPRNCIGMRLALMELKVGVARVLRKYRIVPGPDTDIPLKIMKWKQFPTPENGIKLRVELL